MIQNLYAIRDKHSGFLAPSPFINDEVAKRDFSFNINNNPGILNFSPSDFDLYCIGTFDNTSAEIKMLKANKFICNGLEVFYEK